MRFKTVLLITVTILITMTVSFGCGNTTSINNSENGTSNNLHISGDPLAVLSRAIENLKQSTDFEAQKTFTVKINGKETSVRIWHFITNSSNLFSLSAVEIRNGQQNVLFKRVHLKNVQYESDSNSSTWKPIGKEQKSFYFTYDYYTLNRNLVLDLLNDIYSPATKHFGDFVEDLKKTGTKQINGINTIEYTYSYKTSDDKRDITRNGKIYIGEVNGKVYPIEVFDDKIVKFKSNGTTVENITQIIIKNIGNAPKIAISK